MLLKDAVKMMDSKFHEEIKSVPIPEMTKFEFTACNSDALGGYCLMFFADGKHVSVISSKRQDRRVFKTLDTVRKTLSEFGIKRFDVIG